MPQDHLEYSFRTTSNPRVTVLTLHGALTLSTIFDLQQKLHEVDADLLILDCSKLEYMDSAGLGVVVNSYVSQSNKHRKIAIAGVSERVWALFTTTRVDQFFPRFHSVEEAEKNIG
ncbi:MAG TPA: STAS domain-containing protein [Acidobacteriaceae bacterium]|jgi:anti-sigma B factor antagonist|nr:STAS domain-containing protein [Acidobacteriaceae bacterium]